MIHVAVFNQRNSAVKAWQVKKHGKEVDEWLAKMLRNVTQNRCSKKVKKNNNSNRNTCACIVFHQRREGQEFC